MFEGKTRRICDTLYFTVPGAVTQLPCRALPDVEFGQRLQWQTDLEERTTRCPLVSNALVCSLNPGVECVCAYGQHNGRDTAKAQLRARLWWTVEGTLGVFDVPFNYPADHENSGH